MENDQPEKEDKMDSCLEGKMGVFLKFGQSSGSPWLCPGIIIVMVAISKSVC